MTLEEFAKIVNKSQSTILSNWNRTRDNLAKKGIYVEKVGHGNNVDYRILETKEK